MTGDRPSQMVSISDGKGAVTKNFVAKGSISCSITFKPQGGFFDFFSNLKGVKCNYPLNIT